MPAEGASVPGTCDTNVWNLAASVISSPATKYPGAALTCCPCIALPAASPIATPINKVSANLCLVFISGLQSSFRPQQSEHMPDPADMGARLYDAYLHDRPYRRRSFVAFRRRMIHGKVSSATR